MFKKHIQVQGLNMAYVAAGNADAEHVVLLVHGIPVSSHLFRKVQLGLSKNVYSVAVDLPG